MTPTLKWLLVVLALVVLGGGGYRYLNKGFEKEKSDLQKQITELQSKTTTPTSTTTLPTTTTTTTPTTTDETADWKTYTSSQYGYQIKFPKDWVINTTKPKEITLNSPENEKLYKEITSKPPYYSDAYALDMTINYYENLSEADGNVPKKYKTFSDLINDKSYFSNVKEITLGGQKAYGATEGGMGDYYAILAERSGHIYRILFGNRSAENKLNDLEKKILSTFQFTK